MSRPFPAGETAEPFIDADDLAGMVVATLTEDGHIGLVHELTGPRLLTFAEVAAEIGRAAGRDVRYVPVSVEAHTEMLQQCGLPAPDAQWLAGLFGMLLDGHNASLTSGVRGRGPGPVPARPGPLTVMRLVSSRRAPGRSAPPAGRARSPSR